MGWYKKIKKVYKFCFFLYPTTDMLSLGYGSFHDDLLA